MAFHKFTVSVILSRGLLFLGSLFHNSSRYGAALKYGRSHGKKGS